jgi:ferredoxin
LSFTIKVDDELCMGAQRCVVLAPKVFDLTGEGIAEVTDASSLTEEEAEKLAHECPNMAIVVEKS